MMYNVPQDSVSIDFFAEETVHVKNVNVTLSVTMTLTDQTTNVNDQIKKTFKSVIDGDWEIKGINRTKDTSGFEVVTASASQRVPVDETNGISTSVSELSKPGLQLSVVGLDYSLTQKDLQDVQARLRHTLYGLAKTELGVINSTLDPADDIAWRVGSMHFTFDNDIPQKSYRGGNVRTVRAMQLESVPMAMAAGATSTASYDTEDVAKAQDTGLGLTSKVQGTAHVTYNRLTFYP